MAVVNMCCCYFIVFELLKLQKIDVIQYVYCNFYKNDDFNVKLLFINFDLLKFIHNFIEIFIKDDHLLNIL